MTDIRSYLSENKLVFDGAMGTILADITTPDSMPELLNIEYPEKISEIHGAYIAAGAKAIKTNTFGVNRMSMSEKNCRAVIEAGFDIAQKFADKAYVFADIGPVGVTDNESAADEYIFIADIFLALGARHFIFETNSVSDGLFSAARHIKAVCPDAFVIVSYAVLPDGFSRAGKSALSLLSSSADEECIDAVGLNCASGARHMAKLAAELPQFKKPLAVMPNAGYPTVLGNRTYYDGDPKYFAKQISIMAAGGASIVGGCCGTTPDHISAIAGTLENGSFIPDRIMYEVKRGAHKEDAFYLALCDKNARPVAVELDPPENADVERFMAGAAELKAAGASVITIADCPIARARVDSSILACKVKRELNIDVLPHMTCRDRNLNAVKALLLGLSAEGVHNVLTVTGDPIPSAERSEVKSVYNFNSRMLADYITSLGEGVLQTPFRIYAALNVNARNFDIQLKIAEEKERAGVSAFLTQPILTEGAIDNLRRARATLRGKLLGGIFPLISHRNACFMSSEVAGVKVDERIIALYENKTREQAEELALKISADIAERICPYVDGYYVMTPFSRTELVGKIIKRIAK